MRPTYISAANTHAANVNIDSFLSHRIAYLQGYIFTNRPSGICNWLKIQAEFFTTQPADVQQPNGMALSGASTFIITTLIAFHFGILSDSVIVLNSDS